MEFKLEKPIEALLPQAVNFNFEPLKAELIQDLEKYQNMVVTEENTKEAKDDRAKLNKLRTSIDDERKLIKKAWNVPYDVFEKKVKELTGLIEKPISTIDKQLSIYEDRRKTEKKEAIEAYFEEKIGAYGSLVMLEKVFDPRWLNVSFDIKKIKEAIDALIERVDADVAVIKALEVACEQRMLDAYFETLDLASAMREKTRFEERLKQLELLRKQDEAKKQREAALKEQRLVAERERRDATPIATPQQDLMEVPAFTVVETVAEVEELQMIDFRVFVTPEQKQALKQFLLERKIRFGPVPRKDA